MPGLIYFKPFLLYALGMKWLSAFLVVLLAFGTFCPMTLDLDGMSEEGGRHAAEAMDEQPSCESSKCFVHGDGEDPVLALDMEVFVSVPTLEFVLNKQIPTEIAFLSTAPPFVKTSPTQNIVLRC